MSLLEVLVALVILGSSAAILFEWVLQLNNRLRVLNDAQAQVVAQQRAIEFLNTINPHVRGSGTQRFADFELKWQAKRATPYTATTLTGGARGSYSIAVFDVQAQLLRNATTPWAQFDTRLAGWRPFSTSGTPHFGADVAPGDSLPPEGADDDPGSRGDNDFGNPSQPRVGNPVGPVRRP